MIEEEEKDECPYYFSESFQKFSMKDDLKQNKTYDDLLYHPCEDEKNLLWV